MSETNEAPPRIAGAVMPEVPPEAAAGPELADVATGPEPALGAAQVEVPAEPEPAAGPEPVEGAEELQAADAIPEAFQVEEDGFAYHMHRMEISGFKSFSDRTSIEFPLGITAVVGPNGCGKSNIGDAINWVLGAQSPKLLRGTTMQDVIFSGTEARRPMGMAEVSIRLAGSRASDPDERRETAITRRLFRDGESDYLLNGRRARLKDIQEILRRARVGAKTYATIEQGQIDQILNAKPRDRRLIIEDAAGVSGFKHKRRLAEMKLQATEANLLRVNDIVSEVHRQINSLKRQAAKARRYQRLREELRAKKHVKFAHQAREMDAELARLREKETKAREAESAAAARLATLEAELAAERHSLDEADRDFRDTARRLHQLEAEVDRKEERIEHCRQRILEAEETAERLGGETLALGERKTVTEQELSALTDRGRIEDREIESLATRLSERQSDLDAASSRLEGLRGDLDEVRHELFGSMNRAAELRNERRSIQEAIERENVRIERLGGELEESRGEASRLDAEKIMLEGDLDEGRREVGRLIDAHEIAEQALREARGRIEADATGLASAREREQSAAARLRTLEDVATRFAGVSDGVRMLLTSGSAAGVRTVGVVADFVEAGRQLEGAAELYLQAVLPAVVLEDDSDAERAAAMLRTEGAGRTCLISRTQPAGAPAVGAVQNGGGKIFPDELLEDPRVLGRLRDHLNLKTSANGFVQDRIGDAIVVENLETALALHRRYPEADYLTPTGDVVYASGIVAAGGAKTSEHGLLAHKRKTREARAQLAEASAEAAGLQAKVEAGRSEIEALEPRPAETRARREQAQRKVMEMEVRAQRLTDERERCRRRAEILVQETDSTREEAQRLEAERVEADRKVAEAEESHRRAEQRLERASSETESADQGLRELAEEVAAVREDLAARRQRLENIVTQRGRVEETLADLASRIEQARVEAQMCNRRAREAAELKSATEEELAGQLEQRENRGTEVADRERAIEERRKALGEREESLRGARADLDARRHATGAAELERTRGEGDRQHLDELCRQELGRTASAAIVPAESVEAGGEPAAPPEELDLDALASEIDEITEKIERVGPVNMTAIEEFSDLEERHEFLTAQRKDLTDSIDSLRETIRRINRSSRERFNESFDAIRRNYREIFQTLFNGGRADLILEEGEDVLECGIEIMAQPPGKRLGSIQLLSGGEKAMSAIALLFAIFRYQPSPFCLLDEVDAALDDVNVGRFARMLREYAHDTQFIIITHNKLSMEGANLLYGVTMEEPGVSKLVSLQLD